MRDRCDDDTTISGQKNTFQCDRSEQNTHLWLCSLAERNTPLYRPAPVILPRPSSHCAYLTFLCTSIHRKPFLFSCSLNDAIGPSRRHRTMVDSYGITVPSRSRSFFHLSPLNHVEASVHLSHQIHDFYLRSYSRLNIGYIVRHQHRRPPFSA